MNSTNVSEVSYTDAKGRFGETMLRVLKGERLLLTQHGQARVAVISPEDLKLLELLEDLVDIHEARKVLQQNNPSRSAREFFKDLGLL